MDEFSDTYTVDGKVYSINYKNIYEKIAEAEEKAYVDAIYQFYKTAYLRQFVSDFMNDGTLPTDIVDKKRLSLLQRQYEQNSVKSFYWFITVSVRPGVNFDTFKGIVLKQLSKKIIKSYYMVYEVRHEPDENRDLFEGLHCHMLVYSTVRPYDLKRSTKNTFKEVCDVNNPEICNFKNVPENCALDKIDYMTGNKRDSKMNGVELSKKFRLRYDIPAYIESNPPLPCRVAREIT